MGCQNSAIRLHLGFYAARSHSLMRPVGAGNSATLCGLGVFVEEHAEPVVPDDFGTGVDGLGQRPKRAGLFQGSMRPVSVEMGFVFGKNRA